MSELYSREIKLYQKRNFIVHTLDGIFFSFGISFILFTTVIPAYVNRLTGSIILAGLMPAIAEFSMSSSQIFSAYRFAHKKSRKISILYIGSFQRVILLIIAILTGVYVRNDNIFSILIFIFLFFLFTVTWGLAIPVWLDLIAKSFMTSSRGFFIGFRFSIGQLAGILGGFLSLKILERYDFPYNFSYCFFAAFFMLTVSFFFFLLSREPVRKNGTSKYTIPDFVKKIEGILKKDRVYRSFAIALVFAVFGNMSIPMFAIYGIKHLNFGIEAVGKFTLFMMLGQTVGSLILGYIGQKKGFITSCLSFTLLSSLASLLALIVRVKIVYFSVFFISGLAVSAYILTMTAMLFELSSAKMRIFYIALSNLVISPVITIAPIIGSIIASKLSFSLLFSINIILPLIGFVLFIRFRKIKSYNR